MSRGRLAAALCVLLSGLSFYASSGLHECWPLAWLAPAPLLLLPGTSTAAFVEGFLASALGSTSAWPAYASVVSPVVLGISFAILSLLFGATMALARWIAARGSARARALAYPVTAAAVAGLLFRVSPDAATWSSIYTQTGFLPILQTAALVGPSGVVFLLGLLPSAAAAALSGPRPRRPAVVALAWVLVVEVAAVVWGHARMTAITSPASHETVRVGVAASDPDIRFFRTESRDDAIPVVRAYARRVRELAHRGAEIVVLPEKMVGLAPAYRDEARSILADAARDSRVRLVAGLNLTGEPQRRNVAWVFGPEGRMELEYEKRLLVPRYEDGYEAGATPGLVPTDAGVLGIAICRDLLLPRLLRAYGRAHARIVLAPAWDFTTDAAIQARVPVARAIEGGYPIVRAAQEGFLVVVDAAGRVLLRRPSWDEPETLAVVDVPLGRGGTPYAALGDWFVALDGLALVALIVGSSRRREPQRWPRLER